MSNPSEKADKNWGAGVIAAGLAAIPALIYWLVFGLRVNIIRAGINDAVPVFYILIMACGLGLRRWGERTEWLNKLSDESKRLILMWLKLLIISYGIFLVIYSTVRFINFQAEAIDISYYHLAIWQLAEFKLPYIWETSTVLWSQHFEPIIFLLVPVYWLVKSTVLIMFIQATVVVSGGIALYLSAKKLWRTEMIGIGMATAYLAFGGLQFGYAYGWHPILFFPSLFLWQYYAFVNKKNKLYYLLLFITLLVKEEVGFIMLFWGVYLMAVLHERRKGLITAAAGLVWLVVCFKLIFPYFNPGGFGYLGQYGAVGGGGGFGGIAEYTIKHPGVFIKNLVQPKFKVDTIFHSLGAFAFLPLAWPASLVIVIPSFLEKLLSSDIAAMNGFHYSAAIAGVMAVASMEALRKRLKKNQVWAGIFILYVAIFVNLLYGYHRISILFLGKEPRLSDEEITYLYTAIRDIPKTASVSAQYSIAPHINLPYGQIRTGPRENEEADYVLVNTGLPVVLTDAKTATQNLKNIMEGGRYEVVMTDGKTVLFRRRQQD